MKREKYETFLRRKINITPDNPICVYKEPIEYGIDWDHQYIITFSYGNYVVLESECMDGLVIEPKQSTHASIDKVIEHILNTYMVRDDHSSDSDATS